MPDEAMVPDELDPDKPTLGGFGHATSIEPGVEDEQGQKEGSDKADPERKQADAS